MASPVAPGRLEREGAGSRAVLVFSPEATALIGRLRELFDRDGVEAYLVGGAVRDALLGRLEGDLDVAVAGDVEAVARSTAKQLPATLVVLDEARHVYRLVIRPGHPYVDLTPLRGDVETDARLRDVTINALAVSFGGIDLQTGEASIEDPTGGRQDLGRREVRAVSANVFLEDGARLLRAVRLAAELHFSIEPETAARIRAESHLLRQVAGERIRDEFCRILLAPGVADHLRLLDDLGLLTIIVPELEESRGVGQPKEHYWPVLDHSIEAVGAVEKILRVVPGEEDKLAEVPWGQEVARYFDEEITEGHSRVLLAKIGALLHDVAKPVTKTVEADGRIRFLGHPSVGAEMSDGLLQRLRFSNREIKMISTMVKEHLRPGLLTRGDEPPTRRAVYRFFRDAGDVAVDTLYLNLADYLAARGPLLEADEWKRYAGGVASMIASWREQATEVKPPKLIDGHDIMREFGVLPGPQVGSLLESVRESEAAGEVGSKEQALDFVGRLLKEPAKSPGVAAED